VETLNLQLPNPPTNKRLSDAFASLKQHHFLLRQSLVTSPQLIQVQATCYRLIVAIGAIPGDGARKISLHF
jgi:hypothetical protein